MKKSHMIVDNMKYKMKRNVIIRNISQCFRIIDKECPQELQATMEKTGEIDRNLYFCDMC